MVTTPIPQKVAGTRLSADEVRGAPWSAPLRYWHLLSLDAPTVVATWCCAFAYTAHIRLPLLSPLLLGMATWLLYVADRLLDGKFSSDTKLLKQRHHFHARHSTGFLAAALPLTCLVLWLAAYRMDPAPRFEDLLLAAAAGLYLLCVHWPSSRRGHSLGVIKEVAVALIFAIACVIPAWSRHPVHLWLVVNGTLFAVLCWLNCVAIEIWEAAPTGCGRALGSHLSTRATRLTITHCMSGRLQSYCLGLGIVSLVVTALTATVDQRVAAVAGCIAVSAFLLCILDRCKTRFAPVSVRALADAVLMSPILLVPLASWLTK